MDLSKLKRLFPGPRSAQPVAASHGRVAAESRPSDADTQAATRRDLVRVVTRDTQRLAGIPEHWLEAQVLLEGGRDGQTFVHLLLVVRHWDVRLLKYAVAFQRRLVAEIEHFDPAAREWLLSTCWRYDADDSCPYLRMPDPASWADTPAAPAAPAPPPLEKDELQEDLARLFAVRDANLTEPLAPGRPADAPGPHANPMQGKKRP